MSLSVPHRLNSARALAPRLFIVSLFALALCLPASAQQPQGAAQAIKLDRIEFKGLEHVSEADALAKSGLQAGQTVTIDDIEAASDRLLQSGLFQNLSYQVKGKADKAVLTFTVVEPKGGLPVAFDNFIWFTDDELKQAVKSKVPAYDGVTAPDVATEPIRKALEDLLRERKIEGTVEYNLSSDVSGRKVEHMFSVKGGALRVCKMNYVGARALTEEALVQKSGGIFDNDYSRSFAANFVESNLIPLYQERGYLRASFAPPTAKPDASADCEKGVAVTMYVNEGDIYVWDKASWEGDEALTPQALDAALGMRPKEVANMSKISKGMNAVRRAYARKGYLGADLRAVQEFDDTARTVSYRFQVKEGPQYTMGELTITGLSEVDANNLRGRWRLLHGDPYEEGYLDEFGKKVMPEFLKDAVREGRPLPPMKVESKVTPDHQKHTVDVTLNFKPAPPPAVPNPSAVP